MSAEVQAQPSMVTAAQLQPAGKERHSDILRQAGRFAGCAFAFYLVLLAFPPAPVSLGPGADPGSMIGFNMAHAYGLVMGRDLFWTYGPLTYLVSPDPISGDKYLSLMFPLGIYLAWAGAFLLLIRRCRPRGLALWAGLVLASLGLLNPLLSPERAELALITVALLPLAFPGRFRYLEIGFLGVLAGIATLLRFNLAVQYGPMALGIWAFTVWRDRPLRGTLRWQAIAALLAYPVSTFVIYLVANGRAGSFVPWARYSVEIAGSFSEAMTLPGPRWQTLTALTLLATVFLLIPLIAKKPVPLLPGLLISLFVAFGDFKHGFVRQDMPHSIQFAPRLAVTALLVLFCAATRRDRRLVIAFQVACLVLATAYVFHELPGYSRVVGNNLYLAQVRTAAPQYWNWSSTWQRLARQRSANLAPLRLGETFHRVVNGGTVDPEPYELSETLANGWRWRPAPIFEMYVAYTPALDSLNAAHYSESALAPEYVLMGWYSVDGRNPMFDTPLSWRSLLNWYDLRLQTPTQLLLSRRTQPRCGAPQPLGSTTARWNHPLAVPQYAPALVMAADIRLSLWGKLRTLAFRLNPMWVDVVFHSGRRSTWRVLRANSNEGVIVNPFAQNVADVGRLFLSDPVSDPVVSLTFHTFGRHEYASNIPIRWYRLPIASSDAH
jgi:hypothetical protein